MKAAPETLVYFYSEAVIQLGFISFFAVSFPFAPIFSFFTNLLSLKLKLKIMAIQSILCDRTLFRMERLLYILQLR